MVEKKDKLNSHATLSIEDVERVVSTIVKYQAQVQKDHFLSIITDIDKDKTRLLLALGELKISLLEEIRTGQKETTKELLVVIKELEQQTKQDIESLKEDLKEQEQRQEQKDANCKNDCSKQREVFKQEQKTLSDATNAAFEKRKPNYYAIIPLFVVLTTPFVKWFFELHATSVNHGASIALLSQQHKEQVETQKMLLNKIENLNFYKKPAFIDENMVATPTKRLGGD